MRVIRHLENTAFEESLKGFEMFSLEERRQRGDMVTNVSKAEAERRTELLLAGQKSWAYAAPGEIEGRHQETFPVAMVCSAGDWIAL